MVGAIAKVAELEGVNSFFYMYVISSLVPRLSSNFKCYDVTLTNRWGESD